MEEIADYLFENSDDFKDCHYLALMNLISTANTKIKIQINIPVISYQPQSIIPDIQHRNYKYNFLINKSSRPIEISEEQWVRIGEILEQNNVNIFVHQLDLLIPQDFQINPRIMYKHRFVLPETLSKQTRQKIHIMSSVTGDFETSCEFIERIPNTNQWKKKLNIFIRNF